MEYVHIKAKEPQGAYYCTYCESWIKSKEDLIWEEVDESRGEYWGIPCTEHCVYVYCPFCNEEGVIEASELIYEEDEDDERVD